MFKHLQYIAVLALLLTSCAANGSDKNIDKTPSTRSIEVGKFTGIDSSCGINVTYSQGKSAPVSVTAPAYLFEYLNVTVKNGVLDLSIDNSYFHTFNSMNESVTVTVSAPGVNDFDASSGSSITVKNALSLNGICKVEASSGASITLPALKAAALDAEISSGASVSIDLCKAEQIEIEASSAGAISISGIDAKKVSAEASSGASVNVDGVTKNLDAEATSGASFNGTELMAQLAEVEASSGGSVNYNAIKSNADVSISGSANNHYNADERQGRMK